MKLLAQYEMKGSLADATFRKLAEKTPFVADPSFAHSFSFLYTDGGEIMGCLGYYPPNLATFWVEGKNKEWAVLLVKHALKTVFQRYKKISYLQMVLSATDKADDYMEEAALACGFKFITKKEGKIVDYNVYQISREEYTGVA